MGEKKPVIGLSWEPKLPPFSSSSSSNNTRTESNTKSSGALWRSNSELIDGLFVPPTDPRKLNKVLKSQAKDTLGKDWFDMPAPTITPELKKDFQLLKLRSVIDPKRHYKKSELKSKGLPKYFHVGTVIQSPTDFFSARLTKKERKPTLAEEIISDATLAAYRKRKVREIQEQNHPGGNENWKIKGRKSRKRAKERRH
ncbi:rRNA-processing protein fcf2-like [Mercurialis annua]|uniref:rRNA-processing protein fcf2-like n=1 Tax=Mercurialis annua TaxID=3986 RepID=UPI002160A964|nr:rRNA-processing protein fcf2-like [Mercurialis annua]